MDQRADLYSLGILAYEVLAGSVPYTGQEPAEVLQQHLTREPPPLGEVRPDVPEPLVRVIERLMAKSPSDRYSSAAALLQDLHSIEASLPHGPLPAPPQAPRPEALPSLKTRLPLVERHRELAELRQYLKEAGHGRGSCILLAGEAGIGKSRLLEEFREHTLSARGGFLFGKCDEYMSKVPYHPFGELLAELAEQFTGWSRARQDATRQRWQAASGPELEAALRLAPALKGLLIAPPDLLSGDASAEAERYLNGLCRFLSGAATPTHPLVLAIDDLQWAQEETLQTFVGLARLLSGSPAVLVGLFRTESLPANPPLRRCLELVRGLPCGGRLMRLDPLSPEGVRTLIRELIGMTGGGQRTLYAVLHRITRGNPFFIRETLRTLVEQRILQRDPEGRGWLCDQERFDKSAVSMNLLELILQRLERLSPPTLCCLSAAAVIGGQFDCELLLAVGLLQEEGLLDALDELVELQFIQEIRGGRETRYQFFHDKIREAIYERIPPEQKRELHQRAGAEIERRTGSGSEERTVFDLAYHFRNGLDAEKALGYCLEAGRIAISQNANREALHYFQEAVQRCGEADTERYAAMQEQIGDLCSTLGEYPAALEAFERTGALRRTPAAKARIECKIGTVFHKQGDDNRALQHLEQALTQLGKSPRKTRLGLLVSLFLNLLLLALPRRLRTGRGPSATTADKRERYRELCRVFKMIGYLCFFTDVLRGLEAHLLHLRYARKAGDAGSLAEVCRYHSILLGNIRRFRRARQYLRVSGEIYETLGDNWGRANAAGYGGFLDHFEGRLDPACRSVETALETLEKAEAHWEVENMYFHGVLVAWARGDFARALRYGEKTLGLGERGRDLRAMIGGPWILCMTHSLKGETEKAAPHLERLRELALSSANPLYRVLLHWAEGTLQLGGEAWGPASRGLAKAVHVIRSRHLSSFPTVYPFLFLIRALLRRSGETVNGRERRKLLRRAAGLLRTARFRAWGFPIHTGQWWVLEGIYQCLRGNGKRGRRSFRRGVAILERTRADYLLASACREIAQHLAARGFEAESLPFRDRAEALDERLGVRHKAREPAAVREPETEATASPTLPQALAGQPTLCPATREMNSVLEAGRLVASSPDFEEVLERILDLSMAALGAERGILMLSEELEGDRQEGPDVSGLAGLRVRLARAADPAEMELREPCRFSRRVAETVAATVAPLVVADVRSDPRFGPDCLEGASAQGSAVCVPLLDQERLAGLLYLDNQLVPRLFSSEDLVFLQSLASFAVAALKNARAFAEIRRQKSEIEQLQERLQNQVVYLTEEIKASYNFEEMVGASPAMQEVFRFIERAAPLAQPVLILGETGTGKELVARAIHRIGPRRDRPMIKVNCGAIPEGLLESELFGHVKGAYTGAFSARAGRFELASGGTLFLDEIGEMSPQLQAKLLRVLEDGEFERLGDTRTRKADACIISATNRDLEQEIVKGAFREDLYYRLNVLPIRIPPLRERPEDIPLLLSFFIAAFKKEYETEIVDLDRASLEAARAYPWPGNVREMKHLVRRAVAMADSPCLRIAPLLHCRPEGVDGPPPPGNSLLLHDYATSVEASKKRILLEALERTGGARKEAAKILGISPSSLSNLLRKFGINAG